MAVPEKLPGGDCGSVSLSRDFYDGALGEAVGDSGATLGRDYGKWHHLSP
jgi:hypothetical protein